MATIQIPEGYVINLTTDNDYDQLPDGMLVKNVGGGGGGGPSTGGEIAVFFSLLRRHS